MPDVSAAQREKSVRKNRKTTRFVPHEHEKRSFSASYRDIMTFISNIDGFSARRLIEKA